MVFLMEKEPPLSQKSFGTIETNQELSYKYVCYDLTFIHWKYSLLRFPEIFSI